MKMMGLIFGSMSIFLPMVNGMAGSGTEYVSGSIGVNQAIMDQCSINGTSLPPATLNQVTADTDGIGTEPGPVCNTNLQADYNLYNYKGGGNPSYYTCHYNVYQITLNFDKCKLGSANSNTTITIVDPDLNNVPASDSYNKYPGCYGQISLDANKNLIYQPAGDNCTATTS